MLTQKAFAKINLTLDVTGKKPDGYHTLETVMQAITFYDVVSAEKAEEIKITTTLPWLPTDRRNTCFKAAERFFERTGISGGVRLHIEKKIPSQAGLGGGSADAAAVLRLLNELYDTRLSYQELIEIAAKVGADVPFLIENRAAVCRGIGEELSFIPLKSMPVLIVKPGYGVSTPEAYRLFDERRGVSKHGTEKFLEAVNSHKSWFGCLSNDLEDALEDRRIAKIRMALYDAGAEAAQMSGSGSAVFGLFRDKGAAVRASKLIKEPLVKLCRTI